VLSVVGTGPDLETARDAAYRRLHRIRLDGGQYRIDIALAASRQQREDQTARA
jgi:phosphoribosylamine--glycine ligase